MHGLFWMEYLAGRTLKQVLAHESLDFHGCSVWGWRFRMRLRPRAAGIVRWDIKPANILTTDRGAL